MKRSRRYLRITREGWSFVFILCFIIIGSVLQQINLLVMLAGLMIAPLLFNWRIALNSIFQLELKRKLPDWSHAGQTVMVEWQAVNQRRLLPAWGIKITDYIRRDDVAEKKATQVESLFAQINPGQQGFALFRCHFGQRGIYYLGPATVSSRFPLGLVKAWYVEKKIDTLVVAPRLGEMTQKWNRKIDSSAVGMRSTVRRSGTSQDEFFALRPWRSGDSRRAIHWRSSAKHGEPIVKQFDQQTDRDFAIVLDLWQANESDPYMEIGELAVSFAATVIANVRQKVKGNIAIGLCGKTSKVFGDRVTQEFARNVMSELAEIQPANNNGLVETLYSIGRSVSAAAPLVIISTRGRESFLQNLEAATADDTVQDSALIEARAAHWIEVATDEFNDLFRLGVVSNSPSGEHEIPVNGPGNNGMAAKDPSHFDPSLVGDSTKNGQATASSEKAVDSSPMVVPESKMPVSNSYQAAKPSADTTKKA